MALCIFINEDVTVTQDLWPVESMCQVLYRDNPDHTLLSLFPLKKIT